MLNKCAQNDGHYHLAGILHQVKLSSFRGQPHWNGKSSGNHVLFADPSAWLYRYGGGFRHSAENPGWKHLRIEPAAMRNLSQGEFEYRGYRVVRSNSEETTELQVTVPADCSASVLLPDGQQAEQSPGTVSYCFSLEKVTRS